MWNLVLLFPLLCCAFTDSHFHFSDDGFNSGEDLHRFVSRPDLMPPKFTIERNNDSVPSSGYWFVSPYAGLRNGLPPPLFTPGQVGPHIYDGSGSLVWSGAHLFRDRSTFDFRPITRHGEPGLSFILNEDQMRTTLPRGAGVVLNNMYRITDTVAQTAGRSLFNMHEFRITKDDTALIITFEKRLTDVTYTFDDETFGIKRDVHNVSLVVGNNGFREVDVTTGKVLFEWWALDHLHPSSSLVRRPDVSGEGSNMAWDFFHQNSVDKNDDGDYLISSRYFNAIFKISGLDGSIIWQLGGRGSSFTFEDGLNFSSQHDARWHSRTASHEVITLLNNAADDHTTTADRSSALTISLDLERMTATLVQRLERPDNKLTRLRGNVQQLTNGNTFVCWSENGRISEFSPRGELLLDATFKSHRFVTYRAYKFDFVGSPSEPIALTSLVHGPSVEHSTTSIYVSWNGATEVASWRFYGSRSIGMRPKLLGELQKAGFENVLMVSGTWCSTFVEAVSSSGTILQTSDRERSTIPNLWDSKTCGSKQYEVVEEESDEDGFETEDAILRFGFPSIWSRFFVVASFCGFFLTAILFVATMKIRMLNRARGYRRLRVESK